jgi:nucleotide-binding universal stress UspA family protein
MDGSITFRKIVAATDLGPTSSVALEVAIAMARTFDASLVLVHAYETPLAFDPMSSVAVQLVTESEQREAAGLEEQLRLVRQRWLRTTSVIRHGPTARAILQVVRQESADLVVVGTHGRRGVARVVLGSVAEKIVRLSPVPVLTVHP